MKIHKNELAQQQLEKQKGGDDAEPVELREELNLGEDLVEFQGNMSADFDQAFSVQLEAIEDKKVFLGEGTAERISRKFKFLIILDNPSVRFFSYFNFSSNFSQ